MDVINIITIIKGIVCTTKTVVVRNNHIERFHDVELAQKLFVDAIREHDKDISDEDIEERISDGDYDERGVNIVLRWADTVYVEGKATAGRAE